jgi:uncharacterized protein YpbB
MNNLETAKQLADIYKEKKWKMQQLEEETKTLLANIVELAEEREVVLGTNKLVKTTRKGSVSYSKVVKDLLPDVDLTPYTGNPTTFWSIK